MTQTVWNDENTAELKRLWRKGISASQIARTIGGVSRNAVIGKVHRLGMGGRKAPSRPRSFADRINEERLRKAVPARNRSLPQTPLITGTPAQCALLCGNSECRFPMVSDDGGYGWCGREVSDGSYCDEHKAVVYAKRVDL